MTERESDDDFFERAVNKLKITTYRMSGRIEYSDGTSGEIDRFILADNEEGAIRDAQTYLEILAERGNLMGAKKLSYMLFSPSGQIIGGESS